MNFRPRICFLFFVLLVSCLGGCKTEAKLSVSYAPAMVVSVSSDGHYVISSHRDRHIVLWDLSTKTKEIISTNGNIYSANFIRNSEMFMWQDLNNVVHIQKVDGEEVKSFKHLTTYGQVMTANLKHYFSSDIGWSLFYNYGDNIKKIRQGFKQHNSLAYGKLYNLSLSDDGKYLVTAGDGGFHNELEFSLEEQAKVLYERLSGVSLWNITTLKPIANLTGNSAKTNATISPDGRYVVSGCENGLGFYWETASPSTTRKDLSILGSGVWLGDHKWDKSKLYPLPDDFDEHHGAYLSIKFINDKHFLRFVTGEPYAFLSEIANPFVLKHFSLGRNPFPIVNAYDRNAAIDTAPAVGILVTGQARGGGINVYQYHSETQELEKVWVAEQIE